MHTKFIATVASRHNVVIFQRYHVSLVSYFIATLSVLAQASNFLMRLPVFRAVNIGTISSTESSRLLGTLKLNVSSQH